MATKKAGSALTWITNEAKRLKKKKPRAEWKSLVKQAGAAYRKKAKPVKRAKAKPVKRAAPKKRKVAGAVKKVVKRSSVTTTVKGASIGSLMSQARKGLARQIGDLEVKKMMARNKTERNRVAKEITVKKAQVRKLL